MHTNICSLSCQNQDTSILNVEIMGTVLTIIITRPIYRMIQHKISYVTGIAKKRKVIHMLLNFNFNLIRLEHLVFLLSRHYLWTAFPLHHVHRLRLYMSYLPKLRHYQSFGYANFKIRVLFCTILWTLRCICLHVTFHVNKTCPICLQLHLQMHCKMYMTATYLPVQV